MGQGFGEGSGGWFWQGVSQRVIVLPWLEREYLVPRGAGVWLGIFLSLSLHAVSGLPHVVALLGMIWASSQHGGLRELDWLHGNSGLLLILQWASLNSPNLLFLVNIVLTILGPVYYITMF